MAPASVTLPSLLLTNECVTLVVAPAGEDEFVSRADGRAGAVEGDAARREGIAAAEVNRQRVVAGRTIDEECGRSGRDCHHDRRTWVQDENVRSGSHDGVVPRDGHVIRQFEIELRKSTIAAANWIGHKVVAPAVKAHVVGLSRNDGKGNEAIGVVALWIRG